MTARSTANLLAFLNSFASGNSIKSALASIGCTSENTAANWRNASKTSTGGAWIVEWPPNSGNLVKFHRAFEDARQRSMLNRQTPLREDLQARLLALRENGPEHARPESAPFPREWEPVEHIAGDGHEPPKPPPQTLADHPRAYQVQPLRTPRQSYHRAPLLTRAGYGKSEPPAEGRFSMSALHGDRREYSLAERRAGLPRMTDFGVKRD
jgi:hypothetical protein